MNSRSSSPVQCKQSNILSVLRINFLLVALTIFVDNEQSTWVRCEQDILQTLLLWCMINIFGKLYMGCLAVDSLVTFLVTDSIKITLTKVTEPTTVDKESGRNSHEKNIITLRKEKIIKKKETREVGRWLLLSNKLQFCSFFQFLEYEGCCLSSLLFSLLSSSPVLVFYSRGKKESLFLFFSCYDDGCLLSLAVPCFALMSV